MAWAELYMCAWHGCVDTHTHTQSSGHVYTHVYRLHAWIPYKMPPVTTLLISTTTTTTTTRTTTTTTKPFVPNIWSTLLISNEI